MNLNDQPKDIDLVMINDGWAQQADQDQRIDYDDLYYQRCAEKDGSLISVALNMQRMELALKQKPETLLDVGVGTGQFLKYIIRNAPDVIVRGFDVPTMPSTAWLQRSGLFHDVNHCRPLRFDVITFFDSLEHIPYPEKLLVRIKSTVIVSIPIFEDLLSVKRSRHFRPCEHLNYFTMAGFMMFMGKMKYRWVDTLDFEKKLGRDNVYTFVFKRG